jgi:hypothetical protein
MRRSAANWRRPIGGLTDADRRTSGDGWPVASPHKKIAAPSSTPMAMILRRTQRSESTEGREVSE